MFAHVKSPGRRAMAFCLSAMLAATLYPAGAIALEEDPAQEEPVATEVLEATEGEGEADPEVASDAGAILPEGNVPEDEEVADPVAAADDNAVEEEALSVDQESGQMPLTEQEQELVLEAAETLGNLYFGQGDGWDYPVRVYDVTAGNVTFDEATNTLTLDNATIEGEFWSDIPLTINLVGDSTCSDFYDDGNDVALAFTGDGSLTFGGDIYCGDLTMSGGTVSADYIFCSSLTATGGTVTVSGDVECSEGSVTVSGGTASADCIYCSGLTVTSGTISGNVQCREGSVTVSGGTISVGPIYCGDLTMSGGTISADNTYCGDLTITSGTINSAVDCKTFKLSGSGKVAYTSSDSNNYDDAVSCTSFDMYGGSITATNASVRAGSNFTMSGGSIIATNAGVSAGGSFTMSGGGITATNASVSAGGDFIMSGGTISTSGKYGGVSADENFTMNGGTIKAVNCDGEVIEVGSYTDGKSYAMNIKKGTIIVSNPSSTGIYVKHGDLDISGGTVSVTGSFGSGISVWSNTYRGKTYGGKVNITGGSVTATVRKPSSFSAISADSMTNKPACLTRISGSLPTGATFRTGGNTYQRTNYGTVLASYGSKKTSVTFNKVKYGSYAYMIYGVGANAFNTKRGKKVKSITFKNSIEYLGANAFKNTKALTNFKGRLYVDKIYKTRGNKTTVKIKKSSGTYFAKTAFAGMGKNKGRGLTVKVDDSKEENAALRKFMRKHKLPSGVKFGIYR